MSNGLNVVVKVTTNCPANCKCCINRKNKIRYAKENNLVFSLADFRKVCRSIQTAGAEYVCISGGEPTFLPNLEDYLMIANEYGLRTRLNTNGWGVTNERFSKWIELGLEQVVLSVYSLNRENMKKIRGSGKLYDKTLFAASVISKYRKENKRPFTFIIQTVIMRDNYREMPSLLEFAIDHGADYFWPSYLEDAINLPLARMEKENIDEFRRKVVPCMKEIIGDRYSSKEIVNYLNQCVDKYYAEDFSEYIYHKERFVCDWLGRHLTLYPNGMVYPCPGHEYFSSNCEYSMNYDEALSTLRLDQIRANQNKYSENCKFCPQGVHQELKLSW